MISPAISTLLFLFLTEKRYITWANSAVPVNNKHLVSLQPPAAAGAQGGGGKEAGDADDAGDPDAGGRAGPSRPGPARSAAMERRFRRAPSEGGPGRSRV